jgi:hypothetical protein
MVSESAGDGDAISAPALDAFGAPALGVPMKLSPFNRSYGPRSRRVADP